MPKLDSAKPIRIPTGLEPTYTQPVTTPVLVINDSILPASTPMTTNSLTPVSPKVQQFPATPSSKRQKISSNKHAVLPAIGSTYTHDHQEVLDMPNSEDQNQHPSNINQQPPALSNQQPPALSNQGYQLSKQRTQIIFKTPEIQVSNDRNSVTPSYNYSNLPAVVQPDQRLQYPDFQQYPTPTITTEPPHDSCSSSCQGCGRHVPIPAIKQEPTISDEHSHVQQWLVNPSHPYNIPPTPQIVTTPSLPNNTQQVTIKIPPVEHRLHKNLKHIPIRYMEAPQHQVTNKSGKLLTPEDALKRTLKSKKIPPLTKRNSLRSIFSDASSNLEKIAEELDDEDAKNNGSGAGEKPMENDSNDTEEQVTLSCNSLLYLDMQ